MSDYFTKIANKATSKAAGSTAKLRSGTRFGTFCKGKKSTPKPGTTTVEMPNAASPVTTNSASGKVTPDTQPLPGEVPTDALATKGPNTAIVGADDSGTQGKISTIGGFYLSILARRFFALPRRPSIAPAMRSRPRSVRLPLQTPDDLKNLDTAIASLRETSAVLIQGLNMLQDLHPFVQVAVDVFKLVMTLEMAPQDTSKKVLVCVARFCFRTGSLILARLRNVRGSDVKGPDGLTLEDRMSPLMKSISDDMEQCGNACDVYASKDVLGKSSSMPPLCHLRPRSATMTIKSAEYEPLLRKFVMTFFTYKQKIAFDAYDSMTIGGMLGKIFRRLDTPVEARALAFVNTHWNAKAWINVTTALAAFVEVTGMRLASFDPMRMRNADRASLYLKRRLNDELEEPLDMALEKNRVFFSGKLALHREQLTNTASTGGSVVIELQATEARLLASISDGEHKKLTDADLNSLWQTQKWGGNVKARRFALSLRYHFIEKFTMSQIPGQEDDADEPDDETAQSSPNDRWALAYLGVAYLQQIAEAIDDDGAGYLSIKEVNQFAQRRPNGWSLLHWVAFCAAGGQNSVTWYRTRIYNILSAMVTVLQSVKSENLQAATTYLAGKEMQRVELLLRTTRPTDRPALEGTPLRDIADKYQKAETENMRLLVAKGRVEHYVYPLLYVLLKHQFEVLWQACTGTVDEDKFWYMSTSIASIFRPVDTRKRKLKGAHLELGRLSAILKSHDLDVDERMGQFAFGMFQLTSPEHNRDPINNTIRKFIENDAFKYKYENLGFQHKDKVASSLIGPADSTKSFSTCSEATVLRPVGIKHTQVHLMIQTTRPIHDGEMAVLVPKSKGLAQTVKIVFNGSEPKTCCCCGGTVAPPCWVCLICVMQPTYMPLLAKDTYVCKACRADRATALPNGESLNHTLSHPLLWIFDKKPIVEARSAVSDASLATLEARIAAMEKNFEEKFAMLKKRLPPGGQ
ncbi:hypothetical protein DFH08DRAFT_984329 [Mycena albidolilacea]|uniref:EF-hand domain-containing protein n=1 Tax=Mycena albidolilacea TaxID=1033008 RepID=A0AAD7AB41_9AGAR|nr:hypothetical protein DFH08DRAFT_984329 [Mycena albidolilacea]